MLRFLFSWQADGKAVVRTCTIKLHILQTRNGKEWSKTSQAENQKDSSFLADGLQAILNKKEQKVHGFTYKGFLSHQQRLSQDCAHRAPAVLIYNAWN